MKTKRPADSQGPAACGSARRVTTKSSHRSTLFSCVRLRRGPAPDAEFCALELDPTDPAQGALSRGAHTTAASSRTRSHTPRVHVGPGSATAPEPSGFWLALLGSTWLQHVVVPSPAALCHAPLRNASLDT